jgi:hypothetical protein
MKHISRFGIGVLLVIGVLIVESSTSSSQTALNNVCVNNKTGSMRYLLKNSKQVCNKTEVKLIWSQSGATGATGATGVAGATGATGVAGATGATGVAGTNGTNGVNATVAITQQSVCDGIDAGTVADELCKIGMTGPGGGPIFFVDYNDQYAGLDYLEAAPMGWGNGIAVSPIGVPQEDGSLNYENTGSSTVDPILQWCSNTSTDLGLTAWDKSAVGVGSTHTSTADTTCTSGAIQAASDYAGGAKTDWFLPSIGEASLMYVNLRKGGVGGFVFGLYWSSSEKSASSAWYQSFIFGEQGYPPKDSFLYVRPVRSF